MLIRKPHRLKSWRLSRRTHETVRDVSIALDIVQRAASEIKGEAFGAPVLR